MQFINFKGNVSNITKKYLNKNNLQFIVYDTIDKTSFITYTVTYLGNNLYKLETIYSIVPTFFKSLKELKEYLKFLKSEV